MPKENIEGFDFTKDFTEQSIYELLKEEILENFKVSFAADLTEDDIKVKYNGECMSYEQNNKLYSAYKLGILVRTGIGIWKEYVLLITPFNCYFYRWNENLDFRNDKQVNLTKEHRSNMKMRYGEVYKKACREFIEDVKNFRIDLEENLHNHRINVINNDCERDMNIVDL